MMINHESSYLKRGGLIIPKYYLGQFIPVPPRLQAREAGMRMVEANKSQKLVWGSEMKEVFPVFSRKIAISSGKEVVRTFRVNPQETSLDAYNDLAEFFLSLAYDEQYYEMFKYSCVMQSMPDFLDNLTLNGIKYWMRGVQL